MIDKYITGAQMDNESMDSSMNDLDKMVASPSFDEDFVYEKVVSRMKQKGYQDVGKIPQYSILPEYKVVSQFNRNKNVKLLAAIAVSISNESWELMDLDGVEHVFKETMYALKLVKRYRSLSALSKGLLTYSDEGFHVAENTFNTLDEIEKAIKNKAFL